MCWSFHVKNFQLTRSMKLKLCFDMYAIKLKRVETTSPRDRATPKYFRLVSRMIFEEPRLINDFEDKSLNDCHLMRYWLNLC